MPQNKHELALEELKKEIRCDIPGFQYLPKEDSKVMRFIGKVIKPINEHFMEDYTTTLYPKVYRPKRTDLFPPVAFRVLAHEWVHLHETKKITPLGEALLYLFPQWLSIFSLLSILSIWFTNLWALSLLALLFLLPIPAYFRAKKEMRAYKMSMAVVWWTTKSIPQTHIEADWLRKRFSNSEYYFMWPFKKQVNKWVDEALMEVFSEDLKKKPLFREVRRVIADIWKI